MEDVGPGYSLSGEVTGWATIYKYRKHNIIIIFKLIILAGNISKIKNLSATQTTFVAALTKKNYTILQNYGTMELWFTMKNYGTMEKTMVLWKKLWYYTENYGTSIYEEKNMVDYQKLRDFD